MAKKNWDIQVLCQYTAIITMFDVADFKQHMSMIFFSLSFIIGVLVRFKIFNIIVLEVFSIGDLEEIS